MSAGLRETFVKYLTGLVLVLIVVGGLVMGTLNNGMSILGIGIDWQQMIKGLVLLAAVAFDIYNQSKK